MIIIIINIIIIIIIIIITITTNIIVIIIILIIIIIIIIIFINIEWPILTYHLISAAGLPGEMSHSSLTVLGAVAVTSWRGDSSLGASPTETHRSEVNVKRSKVNIKQVKGKHLSNKSNI